MKGLSFPLSVVVLTSGGVCVGGASPKKTFLGTSQASSVTECTFEFSSVGNNSMFRVYFYAVYSKTHTYVKRDASRPDAFPFFAISAFSMLLLYLKQLDSSPSVFHPLR